MTTPSPRLLALGTALPPGVMTSEEYANFAVRMLARVPREAALLHAIVRRSGIASRHSVLIDPHGAGMRLPFYEDRDAVAPRIPTTAERMQVYAREAPPLALRAARDAIDKASIGPQSITHLVTASCTGFMAPGLDYEMLTGLGLHPQTPRTHIGFMGCHAAINALATARAICMADPRAIVLGVTAELCTLHFQPGLRRDDALPNALFGDAAASFILAGASADVPRCTGLRLAETRSRVIPDTSSLMTWRVVDTGFRMTLDATVPDVISAHLPALVKEWGWRDEPNTAWAIHPGGPRILEAAARAIGLSEAKTTTSRAVLSQVGNISSPTVLFILKELLESADHQSTVNMMAFGPGLAVEAARLRRSTPADPQS